MGVPGELPRLLWRMSSDNCRCSKRTFLGMPVDRSSMCRRGDGDGDGDGEAGGP